MVLNFKNCHDNCGRLNPISSLTTHHWYENVCIISFNNDDINFNHNSHMYIYNSLPYIFLNSK
jgi:hypothetical protein